MATENHSKLQNNVSRREVVHLRSLTSAILAYYSPSYSPYDVISDVIGNLHYSASYPYVIVDLRGARVRVRVRAKARVTLGLHASSPKPNVSACAARPGWGIE